MAKATKEKSLSDILGMINDITGEDKSVLVLSDDKNAYINDYIGLGNYALNAQVTGSIFKGCPSGRILQLSGDSGTGKTFICMNASREAQQKGYFVIWFDTEGATDRGMMERIGIDTTKIKVIDTDSITKINQIILKILDNAIDNGVDTKYLFVIDSIGAINTTETIEKAKDGSETRDMTKQKNIKKLFTTISSKLKKSGFPMIITNHTYSTMNPYGDPKKTAGGSGAEFMPSITLRLSKSSLKSEDDNETSVEADVKKTGIKVTSVQEKARFTKAGLNITFHVSFYKGMNKYLSLEKFLDYDICGVGPGKFEEEIIEEEVGNKKKKVKTGNLIYVPDDSDKPRYYAVKHLGEHIKRKYLPSSKVYTQEVLEKLDEFKIRPYFEFPEYDNALAELESVLEDEADEI